MDNKEDLGRDNSQSPQGNRRSPDGAGNMPSQSPPTKAAAALKQGDAVKGGRYIIKRFVGQGGMGAVYEAKDSSLDINVALKFLAARLEAAERSVHQFLNEARAIAKLNHPNIVHIYDVGECEYGHYISMEFVESGSLADRIKKGKLSPEEARALICPLCDALFTAHKKNVIHRDLKPGNILLDKKGKPKLADFGLAKIMTGDASQAEAMSASGTFYFMSPEQREGGSVDHRTDIYSLGATMYAMLTGETPKVIRESRLPKEFSAVILKCLEDSLDERYFSMEEVKADLLKCNFDTAATAPPPAVRTGSVSETKSSTGPELKETISVQPPPGRSKQKFNLPESFETITDKVDSASGLPLEIRGKKDSSIMALIPAGEFQMGSPEGEGEGGEHPRHEVHLNAYYIDKYEVTFEQYDEFCDATGREKPSDNGWGRGKKPVVNINWEDTKAYCKWAGKRLPTEAEWEKAARGGTDTKYSFGDDAGQLGEYAWYDGNSGSQTHPVGQKKPNQYGLYDMLGNVWEWCADWYDVNYYKSSPERNPVGPGSGTLRVLRGGSWNYNVVSLLRASYRNRNVPGFRNYHVGFRCASSP